MKITKTQLKQIIKEELEAVLDEDNITEDWDAMKRAMGKGLRSIPGLKGDTGARLAADLGLDPEEQARRADRGDYLSKTGRVEKRARQLWAAVGAIGKDLKSHHIHDLNKYEEEINQILQRHPDMHWAVMVRDQIASLKNHPRLQRA